MNFARLWALIALGTAIELPVIRAGGFGSGDAVFNLALFAIPGSAAWYWTTLRESRSKCPECDSKLGIYHFVGKAGPEPGDSIEDAHGFMAAWADLPFESRRGVLLVVLSDISDDEKRKFLVAVGNTVRVERNPRVQQSEQAERPLAGGRMRWRADVRSSHRRA
jgi:hypothetical protein